MGGYGSGVGRVNGVALNQWVGRVIGRFTGRPGEFLRNGRASIGVGPARGLTRNFKRQTSNAKWGRALARERLVFDV